MPENRKIDPSPPRPRVVPALYGGTAALVLILVIANTWWSIDQDRHLTIRAEQASGLVAVRLLDEHVTQTLHDAERNLQTVAHAIEVRGRDHEVSDAEVRDILTRAQPFNTILKSLQFVNTHGVASVSSIDYPAFQTDADDRKYVPSMLATPQRRESVIGRPFQRFYDNELIVPVARNLYDGRGRYLGIISTDISVAYFSAVYARVAKDSHAVVALFSDSGFVIVRSPFNVRYLGMDIGTAPELAMIAHGPTEGFFDSSRFLDDDNGSVSIHTYRKIPGYPITVSYARNRDDVLAAWRVRARDRILVAVALVGLLALLARYLLLYLARLRAADASLRASDEKLRRSEAQFIDIFQYSPVPLALIDISNDRVVEANGAYLRLFGYTREEALGKSVQELKLWVDFNQRVPYIAQLRSEQFVEHFEAGLQNRHGVALTCLLSARILASSEGTLSVFSPIDITHLRAIEHEIRILNEQLEERVRERTESLEKANEELRSTFTALQQMQSDLLRAEKLAALGALVSGVAHELNTPIGNSITLATTLEDEAMRAQRDFAGGTMRRSTLDHFLETSRTGITVLVRNLERAASLIVSFKQVAVAESNDTRRCFELNTALRGVVDALEPLYRDTPHALQLDLGAPVEMETYAGALDQILANCLANSIRHGFANGHPGQMRLATRRVGQDDVEITFSDNGLGIAANAIDRVFDPFFTTTLGQGSSGLGMHIVYNLVTGVLHGKIIVQSAPGQGTTIVIVIPIRAPGPLEDGAIPLTGKANGAIAQQR
ncbi:MAG: ATP-binding protein [Pseudomonadota bacterium]